MLYDSIFMKYSEKANIQRQSRLVVVRAWGWEWEVTANRHEISFWGNENVLKLGCDDSYTTL